MLHIIQVVVSGYAELPKLFVDEALAESAYIEGAKTFWPQSYLSYCTQNGISQESLSSAKEFIKSFDVAEKSKINHWVVKPEDIGLDKLSLLMLGDESVQEKRRQVQRLSEELERKAAAVKKDLADFFGTCSDLVEKVSTIDMLLPGTAGDSGVDHGPMPEIAPPVQDEPEVIDEKYTTPEWQVFVGSIKNLCGGSWSEFPLFNKHDWRQEVYSDLTSFMYWEWAAKKIDDCTVKAKDAGYTVSPDHNQSGNYLFTSPDGITQETSYTSEAEAWCHASFHLDGSA